MDLGGGEENFPVTVWPRLEEPPKFQCVLKMDARPSSVPVTLTCKVKGRNSTGEVVCIAVKRHARRGTGTLLDIIVGKTREFSSLSEYSPDHVAGAGGGPDPSEISFPGCSCQSASCLTSACLCLHYGENYNNSCIKCEGNELDYSKPVFECNTMCQCGELCPNRVVQRGLQFRLEVFKTAKKGWGLRTLESIPKGRFVCEYAGEILDFREACQRIHLQTSNDSNYIIAIREHLTDEQIMETFVDPTHVGNVGRFLNHSCEPNLFMVPVRIDSMVPKLALFAARDICAEEELSYDYSGRYCNYLPVKEQERLQQAKESKKPCYCGTKLCTGFLPYDSSILHKNGVANCVKETL